ncbi:MAG: hypothetical protein F2793_00745 [Actinobacteria bacterium]|uniref:Unannotated protein n=1 Tax=freshwater metagenome TaxID=449393 RepID=A0A6J7CPP6_9ZZZZ|nr:hypothetical protein [Actinomycetota bacterium]
MRRSTRFIVAGSAALLGITVLAGCSSSSSSDSSASAAASTTQMLPPVMVEQGATTAAAKVGDFVVINVKTIAGTTIATSTPDLLAISQGGTDGSADFNPGAQALAVGTGIITVTLPDGSTYDLTVTITE